MLQSDVFKYYGYSLDDADMWDCNNEVLRGVEPDPVGDNDDGNDGLECLAINPDVEGIEPDPAGDDDDGNDGLEYLNPDVEGIESDPVDNSNDGDSGRRRKRKGRRQKRKGRRQRGKGLRHTQYQTQQLLALFEKDPIPGREQREELGRAIGLTHLQIKFWCQNRRTRLREQHKIQEITRLEAENEELRAENTKYKEALDTIIGGEGMTLNEQSLIAENARLKDDIRRIFAITSRHVQKSFTSIRTPVMLSFKEPVSMPLEGMCQPDWNFYVNALAVTTDEFNPGAPSRNPDEIGDSALAIVDPQDGAH